MPKAFAFVILTVAVVALAGPFPTLVNGILVLILSSVVLGHALGLGNVLSSVTKALSGK